MYVKKVGEISARLDGLFDHRHGLARQHGLIHNTLTTQQEHITWHREFHIWCSARARSGCISRRVSCWRRRGDRLLPIVTTHRANIAGQQLVTIYPGPLAHPIHHDLKGLVAHLANKLHIAQLLLHKCALKRDQHEQSEHTVVPILVQTPQQHAEHLEDKERRRSSLNEQLDELWYVHDHLVEVKVGGGVAYLLLGYGVAFGLQVVGEGVAERELDLFKVLFFVRVQHVLRFLKLKPGGLLRGLAEVVFFDRELAVQVDELGEAVVGRGRHLHAFGRVRVENSRTLHKHAEFDEPVAEQADDYLSDGDQRRHNEAELRVVLGAKVVEPCGEPGEVAEKEGPDVEV